MRIRLFCLLLLLAPAAVAQPFEVLLSGTRVQGCRFLPWEVPVLEWIGPRAQDVGSEILAVAANDSGQIYGLAGQDPYRVVLLAPSGERVPFASAPGMARALAVADDGRVYVTTGRRIDRFSAAGIWEASYELSVSTQILDVASDGCTLFYGHGTRIDRINGCSGRQLLPFADVPQFDDLEVQPDGQVLVAGTFAVLLYDAAGNLVRTVATSEPGRTTDQASLRDGVVWMTSTDLCYDSALLRVSLETGAVLSRHRLSSMTTTNGMVVAESVQWPTRRRATRSR